MAISIQEVEHIANLARIELSSEEKKKFAKQLSSILEYVEKINKLESAQGKDLGPAKKEKGLKSVSDCRLDKVESFDNQPELIKQAPKSKKKLIQARSVFNHGTI